MGLCPCAAQPDRSQVLADNPAKRLCVTCNKVFDAPNPEHEAVQPTRSMPVAVSEEA